MKRRKCIETLDWPGGPHEYEHEYLAPPFCCHEMSLFADNDRTDYAPVLGPDLLIYGSEGEYTTPIKFCPWCGAEVVVDAAFEWDPKEPGVL